LGLDLTSFKFLGFRWSFENAGVDLFWIPKYDSQLIRRDEHWTGLGLDWIRTIANFVEFGLEPDCKSLQNLGSGPDLDLVSGK